MDLIKLSIVFGVIVLVVRMNKPLYISMGAGIIASLIIYQIPLYYYPKILRESLFGEATIVVISAFYTITFLQRMLEKRGRLLLAERSISRIFNSRRINATVIPFIIGMLPSAGAVLIAAPIVVEAAGEYLDKDEVTFVTSYYRHISEAFVPTYSTIILALTLTGVPMAGFVLAMIPLAIALFIIGYVFYVRKIPKGGVNNVKVVDYKKEWMNVFKSMWAIVSSVLLILIFKIPVHYAVIVIIILNFFIDKFTMQEVARFFVSAFELKLILTTLAVMTFKEILVHTGVIERLPEYFIGLPISPKIIYALVFFFGTVVVGSQAAIVTILPLAFATIPDASLVYFTLLMSLSYIASQVSPTHVCLGIITENQGTTFNGLVSKTIPVLITFIVLSIIYTFGLSFFLG